MIRSGYSGYAGYPAGCSESDIDAFWGHDFPPAVSEELEEIQNETIEMRRRLDALDKKEVYCGLTPEEEEEASDLSDRIADKEVEMQRISDTDWEEDAKWQRADMRLNEALGK